MIGGKFVAYYRVSTARQGRSGLGLQAQQDSVLGYLKGTGGRVLESFVEVESGKRGDRPELIKALRLAKVTGARLIIAKMDRLSRNASFLLRLRDSGVNFVAADLPNADETVVGIMAVMAQREREMISIRTKEALAVARQRLAQEGRTLGNPNGASALRKASKGNGAAIERIKEKAAVRAESYRETIIDIDPYSSLSLREIAAELNRREINSPRGRSWHATSVDRLRRKLRASTPASASTWCV
jgi:DNA invertase Pin-like site-specific DNA recombinase